MKFEKHIFISYAHLDNEPLMPEQQGWITRFHASLSAMLSMRLGRKAEIWRDSKLQGNDIFADEIVSQFPKTALLVSILTPRYVESEWCTREVKEFCKSAEPSGNLVVDNKTRVIKVIKIPVDNEEALPLVMKLALGYPFYVFDEQQTPLELDPAYGGEFSQKFNLKMAKLAFDIAQLIKQIGTDAVGDKPAAAPGTDKPAVYLGECSFDAREERDALEADLRLHGYTIYPNTKMPDEEIAYICEVDRMMDLCKLSIQPIGSVYGAVPDGNSEQSITVLQNQVAIQQCKSRELPRLIWIPRPARPDAPRQQQFIESLSRDPEAQFGADLITGDIEELKAAAHAALKKLEAPPAPAAAAPSESPAAESSGKSVFILCDERDRKATIPIRKLLKSKGFETTIPLFEGDAATVRQASQDALASCDAVVLFYGEADEAWKRCQEAELKKAQAYRGPKPPLTVYTYLSEPITVDKHEMIELEEPRLIDGLQGFAADKFVDFIRKVSPGTPS